MKKSIFITMLIFIVLLLGIIGYLVYDNYIKDDKIDESKDSTIYNEFEKICDVTLVDNYFHLQEVCANRISNFIINGKSHELIFEVKKQAKENGNGDEYLYNIYLDQKKVYTTRQLKLYYSFTFYTYNDYYIIDMASSNVAEVVILSVNEADSKIYIENPFFCSQASEKPDFSKLDKGVIVNYYYSPLENNIIEVHKETRNLNDDVKEKITDEITETINCTIGNFPIERYGCLCRLHYQINDPSIQCP